jgi:hypothetical protein
MSEDSKYYTPTIEEFHVGFEFETRDRLSVLIDYRKWNRSTFNKFNDMRSIRMCIDTDRFEIRVKHLDREDIESLLVPIGFEHEKAYANTEIKMIKGSIWSEAIKISMCNGIISIIEFKFTGNENSRENYWNLFRGKIKNKSELKRVLTQTGVI